MPRVGVGVVDVDVGTCCVSSGGELWWSGRWRAGVVVVVVVVGVAEPSRADGGRDDVSV